MSTLKSVNWALAWRRSIWTIVWAAMMALLVVMCIDLAANQPVIFGIVMLAAFVGSIGLAYTRVSWHNGAYVTACGALVVSLLAICTHTLIEASYWSSVIDQINEEVISDRAVSNARAVVAEKRKERYAASSNGRSSAQIEAELRAAETNLLWTRSASCADATAKESREFCQSYFLLQSKLAAAKEADKLEGVVWSAGTTIETTAKRNLAAITILASRTLGGRPEEYTAMIVICIVAFTQALLAFALPIGWAPEKPREPRTAAKAPEATTTAVTLPSPAVALPLPPESRTRLGAFGRRHVTDANTSPERVKEIEKTEHVATAPEVFGEASKNLGGEDGGGNHPTGPGTPAPMPEAPKIEEVAESSRNVLSFFRDDGKGPEVPRGKKKAHKPEGKVESWLGTATTQVDDPNVKVNSEACWKSYLSYCDDTGKHPLHRKVFSRQLGVLLGRKTGKTRKRDKNGSVFTGLMINPIVAQRRRVA